MAPCLSQSTRFKFKNTTATFQPLRVVSDRKNGQLRIGENIEHRLFAFRVQCAGHFIQQIQFFTQQQPASQRNPLFFAARNTAAVPV